MRRRARNYAKLIAYGSAHAHSGLPTYMLQSASTAFRMAAGVEPHHEPRSEPPRPEPQPYRMPLSWRILGFVLKLVVAFVASGFLFAALGLMWLMLTTKV